MTKPYPNISNKKTMRSRAVINLIDITYMIICFMGFLSIAYILISVHGIMLWTFLPPIIVLLIIISRYKNNILQHYIDKSPYPFEMTVLADQMAVNTKIEIDKEYLKYKETRSDTKEFLKYNRLNTEIGVGKFGIPGVGKKVIFSEEGLTFFSEKVTWDQVTGWELVGKGRFIHYYKIIIEYEHDKKKYQLKGSFSTFDLGIETSPANFVLLLAHYKLNYGKQTPLQKIKPFPYFV